MNNSYAVFTATIERTKQPNDNVRSFTGPSPSPKSFSETMLGSARALPSSLRKTGALRDCVEGSRLPYSPSLSTHPAVRLPSPPCRLAPSSTPPTAAAPPPLAARARPSRRDSSRTRGGGNPSDRSTRRREPWRTMITMKLTLGLGSPSLSHACFV
jgi:hypothetical protein